VWDNKGLLEEAEIGPRASLGNVIIADLSKEIVTTRREITKLQSKFETPLVGINLFLPERESDYDSGEMNKNPPPYTVQLRLSSGTILHTNISSIVKWEQNKTTYEELFVPETPYIMEKLEMMIDRD